MARLTVLLLIAVAFCCSVQAQKNLNDALAQSKLDLFAKIVKCAGAEEAFKGTKGKVTVLAPTNDAILAFLKSTGLSAEDVLGQEPLCDALLRYHVLPYDMKSSMIVKKDMTAQTLEPRSYLTVNKGPLGVTVQDMQGNVAEVTKGDIKIGEATLHTVDRVLLSGKVFYSVAAAVKYYSSNHAELLKALTATGLIKDVTDPKKPFKGTILAPTDAAFKKLTSTPSTADLKNILQYHVLSDKLVLPGAVKEGTKYATAFTGHNIQFKFSKADRKDQFGQTVKSTVVDVIPETGKAARMLKYNVFAGQGVIHGIDSVLIPKLGAGVTEKAPVMGHRKILGTGESRSNFAFEQQQALTDTAGAISAAASGAVPTGAATAVGSATANHVGGDQYFDDY